MRKTLTLYISPFLLAVYATCFGFLVKPACGQDPQVIFGNSNPPASTPTSGSIKPPAKAQSKIQPRAAAAPPGPTKKTAASAPERAARPRPQAPVPSPAVANEESTAQAPASARSIPSVVQSVPSRPAARPVVRRPAAPPMPSRAAISSYCGRQWMKINTHWDLPAGKNHVILGVDLDASGAVTGTQVSSHPKNAESEAKAQEALTKSQPLDPLPTGLPSAHLTITFDSTADPHGDSSSNGSVNLQYNPSAPASRPASSTPANPTNPDTAGAPTPDQ